jgi:hypothetical protein
VPFRTTAKYCHSSTTLVLTNASPYRGRAFIHAEGFVRRIALGAAASAVSVSAGSSLASFSA